MSFGIFIVLFFLVATIIQFKEPGPIPTEDLQCIILSAIVICPAYLLSLRLLANPVRIVPQWMGRLHFLNWVIPPLPYLARPNEDNQTIKTIKERFVSFHFSIIASVLFTLVFLYAYLAAKYGSEIFSMVFNNFISPFLDLGYILIIKSFFVFLIVLFFTTGFGEQFLRKYEVIDVNYTLIQDSFFDKILDFFSKRN
ncbi:hypothetical protein [Methanoregula sp.]|uniref:hypothetical protein n=1 Tax=Methanoregula sp. TaxID=2052170 RepID=UPI003C786D03